MYVILFLVGGDSISDAIGPDTDREDEGENEAHMHDLHAKWEEDRERRLEGAIQNKISGDWRKAFLLICFSVSYFIERSAKTEQWNREIVLTMMTTIQGT